jgi:hypothetical protein
LSVPAERIMIPDEIGQKLHDRATRGEALTAEEREQLGHWYADHDRKEFELLAAAPSPSGVADLQMRLRQITAQVVFQAQRIEALTAENAQLRQEIVSLQRLLATRTAGQPA